MSGSRRQLLAAVATVTTTAFAGCGGGTVGPSSPPTPTNCPDEPRVPEPERDPEGAARPPIPEPPAILDDSAAVLAFFEAYERAIKWRKWTGHEAPIESLTIEGSTTIRDTRPESVLVDLEARTFAKVDHDPEDDTTEPLDGPWYFASYLVTKQAVWRAETPRESISDDHPTYQPREAGRLLECFSEDTPPPE